MLETIPLLLCLFSPDEFRIAATSEACFQVMVYGRDHPGIRTWDLKKGWTLKGDVEGN